MFVKIVIGNKIIKRPLQSLAKSENTLFGERNRFSMIKLIQPICFKVAGYRCLAEYFKTHLNALEDVLHLEPFN